MASNATGNVEDSGSAAGPDALKAEAGSECPICLGAMKRPAYVAYCMHQFCFRCICHWARARDDCPVCRQSLEQVLHSVRGDDDYELFVVGLPAGLRRRMAADRARSRFPQCHYNLRRRAAVEPPVAVELSAAGRNNEPANTGGSRRQRAAPRPSRAPARGANTPREPTRRTGCRARPDPQRGRE